MKTGRKCYQSCQPILEDLINNINSNQQVYQLHPEPIDELVSVEETAVFALRKTCYNSYLEKKGIIKFIRKGSKFYFSKEHLLASNHSE